MAPSGANRLGEARTPPRLVKLCPVPTWDPHVLDGEVISALLGLMRGQKISEREADAALSNYRTFPVERQDVLPLWPRLKSLHANLSAYDAQYVALAEALRIPLITADARIKRSGIARCEVEVFDAHT